MSDTPPRAPILHDQPADRDALDFQPYVDALADIVLDPATQTPLILGIYGSWGSGKTSLMRMMQVRVTAVREGEAPRHRAVWFDAWKYNQEDVLWRALLLLLLDDLKQLLPAARAEEEAEPVKEEPGPRQLLALLNEALYRETGWTERGDKVRVNWTDAIAGAGGLAASVLFSGPWQTFVANTFAAESAQKAKEGWGQGKPASDLGKLVAAFRREETAHYQAQLRSLEQFQRNFAALVRALLPPDGEQPRRLVVFVDDLDRCLPEKAIQVLEALKLFLDVPGCVFVLGLDPEAIAAAVQTRYKGEVKANEYLEKIIQLPFHLPVIADKEMQRFVEALTARNLDAACAEVFALGLADNPTPRKVKRTLNTFLLMSRLVEKRSALQETLTPVRLAKLVAIQQAYPDLWAEVIHRPGALIQLEAHARATRDADKRPEEAPPLPDALKPFAGQESLRRLLCLQEDAAACFGSLKLGELKEFTTLTRQAAPAVAEPAVRAARVSFEPELVTVPAGPFMMGTSDAQVQDMLRRFEWAKTAQKEGWFAREQPEHEVTLPAFEIGRYPVTNAQYAEFVKATRRAAPEYWPGGRMPEELAGHPVVNVTWRDAMAYCAWLSEATGKSYRLPTEAEWEKAARGADGRLWPWGNEWDPEAANCRPAGPGTTTLVGSYSPKGDSPYGAADMAGNVWEWCSSLWGADPNKPTFGYPYRFDDGREDAQSTGLRIVRGGSWYSDSPARVRCACRFRDFPGSRGGDGGFRVARSSLR